MNEQDDVFDHVGHDRRRFLKRLVVGSAFAVPAVSSFSMSGVNTVFAQSVEVSGGSSGGDPEGDTDATTVENSTTSTTSGNQTTTSTTVGNGGNQPPP